MGSLIEALHVLPPELVSLAMIVVAYGGALLLMALFGVSGLTAFVVIAVLGANIQVIKVVQFHVFAHPVALGTELFASIYLAIDIITENYGVAAARRTIWIGFASQIFFLLIMILTLGYRPITDGSAEGATAVEAALTTIMQPQLGLLAAGLTSYLLSQHLDVSIYSWFKKKTGGRLMWLRNGAATIGSALFDNTVFSVLAWRIFTDHPVPLNSLVFTYILGTFYIRIALSLLDTPFMYASRTLFRRFRQADIAPRLVAA